MALRIAVFGTGPCSWPWRILAFRIIGKTFGTALRETTAVIAIFLISMSLGYWLGGKAGDRWPYGARSCSRWPAPALILLHPAAGRDDLGRSSTPRSARVALLTACALFFAVPRCSWPPCRRLPSVSSRKQWSRRARWGERPPLSTVGSILGTILMGFLLDRRHRGVKLLTVALGGTMLALSALAALGMRLKPAAAGLALLLLAGSGGFRQHHLRARQQLPPHRRARGRRLPHPLLRQRPQSQMSVARPDLRRFWKCDYFSSAFLFKPDIKDVLMLGLGGGPSPKRFLKDNPNVRMDVVDVVPRSSPWPGDSSRGATRTPRLNLIVADGRAYLKRTRKKYDYIMIDTYTRNRYGSTIPVHLTTREFSSR